MTKPQYPDHDFPHPGYLLIPSGYMQLADSGEKSWCDYFEVSENDLTSLPVEKTQDSDEQCSLPVENQPVQAQALPSGRETTFSGSPSEDSSTGSNQQANDSTPTTCITFATTLSHKSSSITTSSTITICGKDGPSIVTESVCSDSGTLEAKNMSKSVSGGRPNRVFKQCVFIRQVGAKTLKVSTHWPCYCCTSFKQVSFFQLVFKFMQMT